MSLTPPQKTGRAEAAFKAAFERLKLGKPLRLPHGSPVSQNNVAKEAGTDPSALKKSRYPELISEIQHWIAGNEVKKKISDRQKNIIRRDKNTILQETINAIKSQRDHLASLLLEADAKILELSLEIERLQDTLKKSNILPLTPRK